MGNVESDIRTYDFILLMESEILSMDYSQLDSVQPRFRFHSRLKRYTFIEDALIMTWGEFISSQRLISHFRNIGKFLANISNYNEIQILRLPVHFTYSLWHYYVKEYKKFFNALEEINSEVESPKRIKKDMSRFGLTNITDFLCMAKNLPAKEIETWTCYTIMSEYQREVYKDLNRREQLKTKKND